MKIQTLLQNFRPYTAHLVWLAIIVGFLLNTAPTAMATQCWKIPSQKKTSVSGTGQACSKRNAKKAAIADAANKNCPATMCSSGNSCKTKSCTVVGAPKGANTKYKNEKVDMECGNKKTGWKSTATGTIVCKCKCL